MNKVDTFDSLEELSIPIPATVRGNIPRWLNGSLIRVGPGKFDMGNFTLNHLLDGFAHVQNFNIEDGRVTFSSKFIQSEAYKKACVHYRPLFTEFGTKAYPDPCKNIFGKLLANFIPEPTDNTSIGVFSHRDEVFASSETCFLYKIDPKTLDTKEKVDYLKAVGVNFATSHPLTDPDSGDLYNLGLSYGSGLKYHILKVPPSDLRSDKDKLNGMKGAKILASIPSSSQTYYSYYHSFAMTDNYIIFMEQPLYVNGLKLATCYPKGKAFKECMEWKGSDENKFIIVDKATGYRHGVVYQSDEAFFAFHHINAFESENEIIVDLVAYLDDEILEKLYLTSLRTEEFKLKNACQIRRYAIPLGDTIEKFPAHKNLIRTPWVTAEAHKEGKVIVCKPQMFGMDGLDLPTINPLYQGKSYRYSYLTGGYDKGKFENTAVKMDMATGEYKVWKAGPHNYIGSMNFISIPGAIEEDDGVLLTSVCDVRKDYPDAMIVLDAKGMTELARAEVVTNINQAHHGVFVPAK